MHPRAERRGGSRQRSRRLAGRGRREGRGGVDAGSGARARARAAAAGPRPDGRGLPSEKAVRPQAAKVPLSNPCVLPDEVPARPDPV